jgi:hypothetical protein
MYLSQNSQRRSGAVKREETHPLPVIQLLRRLVNRRLVDPLPSKRLNDLSLLEKPSIQLPLRSQERLTSLNK